MGIDRCQKNSGSGDFLPSLIPVLSALSSVRLFAVSEAFGIPYGNFLFKPSGVQCPAPPHCDHRQWHRHTARRRDSLPDAQTPPIAGRCLCTFVLAWDILPVLLFMPAGTSALSFTDAYEWLEVLPLSLCYVTMEPVDTAPKAVLLVLSDAIYVLYALSFLLYPDPLWNGFLIEMRFYGSTFSQLTMIPASLALIEHALRRGGHTITCMPHVPADLAAHLAEYDLILLDVAMPQTDGYELCSAPSATTRTARILFLTAKTMEEDVDYGFSVGADDYIKKSPSPSLNCVRARCRTSAPGAARKHHCLSIQGIRFLLASRRSRSRRRHVPFTRTEYEITLLLAKTADRHFPESRSTKRSLGYDKTGDESAITEHIKNIRKNLPQ